MKARKFLAMIPLLAMLLAIALPITAFAVTDGATITIKAPPGFSIDAGDFEAYQLCGVTVDSSGENFAYTSTPALEGFLSAHPEYGEDLEEFMAYLEDNKADLTALVKDLTNHGFTADGEAENDGDNIVVISELDFGYYLVVGKGTTTDDNEVEVIAHSALVTVHSKSEKRDDKPNEDINLKVDAPEIHKYVSDTAAVGEDQSTSVNIGNDVFFKITSVVPEMEGYTSYTFIVYDIMSPGLTYKGTALPLVKLVDPEGKEAAVTIGTSKYTAPRTPILDGDDVVGTALTITFINLLEYKAYAGWDIEITYTATLNANAVIAPASNPNRVYLKYSNNPYITTDTGETPEDEVDVYTFGVDIKKVNGVTSTGLADAKFILKNSAMAPIKFVVVDGKYRVATAAETESATTLTSASGGMINIIGLKAGTYYLEETEAPDGYNLLSEDIQIKIEDNGDVKMWDPKANSGAGAYGDAIGSSGFVRVDNFSGGMLPGTGGIGSTIFYAIGLIALFGIAAGTVVLIRKVKRHGIV